MDEIVYNTDISLNADYALMSTNAPFSFHRHDCVFVRHCNMDN